MDSFIDTLYNFFYKPYQAYDFMWMVGMAVRACLYLVLIYMGVQLFRARTTFTILLALAMLVIFSLDLPRLLETADTYPFLRHTTNLATIIKTILYASVAFFFSHVIVSDVRYQKYMGHRRSVFTRKKESKGS